MNNWGQKVSQWIGLGLNKKASAVGGLIGGASKAAFISFAAPRWTGRTYEQLAREGYRKNVVVHRCVRIVAESAASVPFLLYRGDKRLEGHPILDLLARPNPLQSGKELMASYYAFLEIAGNAYMEVAEGADGKAGELYVLRPERMRIIPGAKGWPAGYTYKVGGKSHTFKVEPRTGKSPIMHLRTFHPEDDYYGLSPLEAAAFAIDIHNSSQNWNKALLDNAARPSGALMFEPSEGAPGHLSDEQFKRLKEELEENYQGAVNAGRPFLLEGGLKWHLSASICDEKGRAIPREDGKYCILPHTITIPVTDLNVKDHTMKRGLEDILKSLIVQTVNWHKKLASMEILLTDWENSSLSVTPKKKSIKN